ncbi:MAG: Phenylalanine--tRNA ligase beta subunit [Microgenomates group bacterium Gr01-1014_16]|nr:MAG: Phenylalanine--tRNA ligase beta subunit [Microgenomates group bacterium Gr01-1014_16]
MQILIPDSWLREYLQTDAKPKDIQKALSLCGPSVERLHQRGTEFIYDIEVTTNRVDMMSVYGIAREAVAILPRFNFQTKLLSDPFITKLSFKTANSVNYLTVKVDPNLCQRFSAILIKNVSIKSSPDWLVKKLELVGMRGLNNVIDISNLLMHELGQPIHTFDYDKIASHTMVLRESRAGELLTTLDTKTHKLPGGDIVIEDGSKKLIDMCGIMGGLNSAVDEHTKNVLLFVQTYEPVHIRRTSMSLAHRTNAAVLFEKDLPIESVLPTMEKSIQLFKQLTGGQPEPITIDILNEKPHSKTVTASPDFINSRLGINLTVNEINTILSSLGFTPQVPWWRKNDIMIPEDIVEEVARIYGYHNLPSQLMSGDLPTNRSNESEFYWVSRIKSSLKYWGFTETYTYSLTPIDTGLKLKNPLLSEWSYLRTSLSHSQVISENLGRVKELNLFEIANVYIPRKNDLPIEELHLVISTTNSDFLKFKGVIEALQTELGTNFQFEIATHPTYLSCEINLAKILPIATGLRKFTPISKFSPIIEDINVALNTKYDTLINQIKKISPLIKQIDLIDKYGDKLTLRLSFHSDSKQLSSEDIAPLRKKLISLSNQT